MNESTLSELQAQVTGYETAVSKLRTEIDELKAELEYTKRTRAQLQVKLTTLHSITLLALLRLQSYDDNCCHDDIGEVMNLVRGLK